MLNGKVAAWTGAMVLAYLPGPAIAQSGAPQAESPQAYVYATVGFDKIKPELILDSASGTATGSYTATQSEEELNAIYYTGTYGITSGTVEGQFSGDTLSGYWFETAYNAGLQGYCENERNGTNVYGRFVLTFSADRKSFTGLRTGCDIVPDAYEHSYSTWTGTLVRRQAATVSNAVKGGADVSEAPVAARAKRRVRGAKPTGRLADSAARAAEDEINAKAEEAARRAAHAIIDKAF